MRRSPLDAVHRELDAKIVPFGGWDMPLQYPTGTLAEHRACRTECGLFDVSHLGTVRVEGNAALERLQRAFTNDLTKIGPGRAQYTHLLDVDGSVLDDIIVWWLPDDGSGIDRFDVVPNASNTTSVIAAIGGEDVTSTRAVLAVQGPTSRRVLDVVIPEAVDVARSRVARVEWRGVSCVVAGTGYTGEDGVEIAIPVSVAADLWKALVAAGATPCGLGARDTLRLEAGLPLHGHELGAGITPLQAGLGWVVAWNKPEFVGRDALVAERDRGVTRRLVGIVTPGRRPARDGCTVLVEGEEVGVVTSGNFSPTLEHGIALAFVRADVEMGASVSVDVRGTMLDGTITTTRFLANRTAH
ncbi:MAG: aminomethyltransferase [Actinomycetota bacterium]